MAPAASKSRAARPAKPNAVCEGTGPECQRWKETCAALVRVLGHVVYERDPSGSGMTFSGNLQSLLGFTEAELNGGWKRWLELVHPDDRAMLKELAPGTNGQPFHVEYRLVGKDGRVVSVRDDGCAVRDEHTGKTRLTGMLLDISEQRELTLQLQHGQKMEAFGRLAGGVAHDFNNLLTIFSGYTDMLLVDLTPQDPRREYLEEMQRAAERASALTSQLLAFSRLQRFSPRTVHLGNVLLEMQKMMRRLIGEDIELVVNVADNLACVLADPRQIETVLINLAVKARDAMPGGGRLLLDASTVTIRPSDRRILAGWSPGAYVQLTVSDTGVGMTEAVRLRVFEPFYTTKAPGRGTGLGLSTCYGIVQQSGGRITVESTPDKGTTFRIFLPRTSKRGRGEGAPATPRLESPLGQGETILLVEDDFAVQKTYATLLRRLSYRVICASNGDEALRIAGQHPEIRLVITDLVMPLMSGTDLAAEIGKILPKAKILLTSGYSSEPTQSPGSAAAVFLPKPLSRDILARKLRELLEAT